MTPPQPTKERQPLEDGLVPVTADRISVHIDTESDTMIACRETRRLAERMSFTRNAAYYLATATAELATNILIHAGSGRLEATPIHSFLGEPRGIELLAEDSGPGIANLELALTEGYSTAGGLGCGLPGVKRLMDAFDIDSRPGQGTRIRAIKWR